MHFQFLSELPATTVQFFFLQKFFSFHTPSSYSRHFSFFLKRKKNVFKIILSSLIFLKPLLLRKYIYSVNNYQKLNKKEKSYELQLQVSTTTSIFQGIIWEYISFVPKNRTKQVK